MWSWLMLDSTAAVPPMLPAPPSPTCCCSCKVKAGGDLCGGRGAWQGLLVLQSPALPVLLFLSTLLGIFNFVYLRGRFHNSEYSSEAG